MDYENEMKNQKDKLETEEKKILVSHLEIIYYLIKCLMKSIKSLL